MMYMTLASYLPASSQEQLLYYMHTTTEAGSLRLASATETQREGGGEWAVLVERTVKLPPRRRKVENDFLDFNSL